MNFKLKHIFTILIFVGFFLSSFQITVNQFIQNIKVDGIELSAKDIDDNEEDSETKKIELEDDYFFSEFNYSFAHLLDIKVSLFSFPILLNKRVYMRIRFSIMKVIKTWKRKK
jgi:hypothetical protein